MVYRGRVKDGVVVLEPLAVLPEGVEVRVEIVPARAKDHCWTNRGRRWARNL